MMVDDFEDFNPDPTDHSYGFSKSHCIMESFSSVEGSIAKQASFFVGSPPEKLKSDVSTFNYKFKPETFLGRPPNEAPQSQAAEVVRRANCSPDLFDVLSEKNRNGFCLDQQDFEKLKFTLEKESLEPWNTGTLFAGAGVNNNVEVSSLCLIRFCDLLANIEQQLLVIQKELISYGRRMDEIKDSKKWNELGFEDDHNSRIMSQFLKSVRYSVKNIFDEISVLEDILNKKTLRKRRSRLALVFSCLAGGLGRLSLLKAGLGADRVTGRPSQRNYGYQNTNSNYEKRNRFYFSEENGEEAHSSHEFPATKKFKDDEPEEEDEEAMEIDEKESSDSSKKVDYKSAHLKAWRLIVRNLPWKTKKEDMQNVCSNFGPFTEIVLPPSKKVEGTCAGFGFVQFKKKSDAEKAREHFNSNKFLGRMVAADWALDKDTYETSAHEEKQKMKDLVKKEKEEADVKAAKKNTKKPKVTKTLAEDDENSEIDGGGEEEEGDEDLSEEEEEKPVKGKKGRQEKKIQNKKTDKAVEEGRVLFLRNLSFETTEERVKEEMERFGKVELTVICKFKESGHSKGTAFVYFSTADEAAACVSSAENGLIIDDRLIGVNPAIPRDQAAELEKEKLTKVPKDNRNLRLLRFGLIRDGTASAKGMSKEDAAKRERLAEAARKKLENSNMFVSPTRLCIHNMPQRIDNAELLKLVKAAASSDGHVTECRVWLDKNRLTPAGKPKSTGFGFIAFAEHKHAMECLQALNNNAETFSNERRPIVEFSIENLCALQAKARRATKSKGESLTDRQLNDKIKQQVKKSIGEVHAAGMKFLPKFLGKKNRHRDMTGKAKKRVQARAKAKALKFNKEASKQMDGSKKKKTKKDVAKYLSLST
ncbi:unnamed protein product [Caenorhabditis auriculariae]|uniref:RRM domain-containing protein n=1 Tax=Caenorhabditis auriculariae TaxID=2777116 RepID=A0A8S1HI17_9PELO|nr:unnamed protein product [Caenorhabditis auriculariae]